MFKGSYVALVTPFRKGRVDEARLKSLVDFHLENGTDGLVPCGSTGESATLSHEEHRRVTEIVIKAAKGRIPVLAGAGSNSTAETVELVHHAEKAGASGVLLVVPYYNKPTQEGLYQHFKTVAKSSRLPIILYNIPGRSAVNMSVETVIRLAQDCPTIVGIKEASGSMDYTSQLLGTLGANRFTVLSGDDSLTLPLLSLGAKGVISVVANLLPAAVAELCRSWMHGHAARALELHTQLFPLTRSLFLETNPIPVKAAMAQLKLCSDELRLPLVPMSDGPRQALLHALRTCPLVRT